MSELSGKLNIPDEAYTELIESLDTWRRLLKEKGVRSHMWFLFGSVVKHEVLRDTNEDPLQAFARELVGARGAGANRFGPASDIDVGAVVDDGHDNIDLCTYESDSPFITTEVDGHELSLTRFTVSWMARRGVTIETMPKNEPTELGIYGQVIRIDV